MTRATLPPAPSIYSASVSGRSLFIGLRSATRSGHVKVTLPGKSRAIGKGKFRLNKAGKGKARVKIARKALRAIKQGKVKQVKVKVTSANGKTRVKTLRVQR